jgi:prolipoprotein diacylglyceryltransferase
MQFWLFVLLVCFFIFLYCVYVLANDDFIFLRRDLTMEKLFNMIFLSGLIGLLASRLFYGFSHPAIFRNPLVFLLIPYFPGLSLLGGVVGVAVYILSLLRHREDPLPLGRISDFFSIAFLISLPVGFIGNFLFSVGKTEIIKSGALAVSYFVLFIVFLKFFLPLLLSGKFKEGKITFLFLIFFSIVNLVSNIFPKFIPVDYFRNFENIIFLIILLLSSGMLIGYDSLVTKINEFKKRK